MNNAKHYTCSSKIKWILRSSIRYRPVQFPKSFPPTPPHLEMSPGERYERWRGGGGGPLPLRCPLQIFLIIPHSETFHTHPPTPKLVCVCMCVCSCLHDTHLCVSVCVYAYAFVFVHAYTRTHEYAAHAWTHALTHTERELNRRWISLKWQGWGRKSCGGDMQKWLGWCVPITT